MQTFVTEVLNQVLGKLIIRLGLDVIISSLLSATPVISLTAASLAKVVDCREKQKLKN